MAKKEDSGSEIVASDQGRMVPIGTWIEHIPEGTPDDIAESVGRRFDEAESMDEILGEGEEGLSLRDLTGHRLRVIEAHRCESSFEGTSGWYVWLTVFDEKAGETLEVSCGAANVVRQVANAYRLGAMPFWTVPYEKPSQSNPGRSTLHLGPDRPPF